jgi:hypothetical protein
MGWGDIDRPVGYSGACMGVCAGAMGVMGVLVRSRWVVRGR